MSSIDSLSLHCVRERASEKDSFPRAPLPSPDFAVFSSSVLELVHRRLLLLRFGRTTATAEAEADVAFFRFYVRQHRIRHSSLFAASAQHGAPKVFEEK